MKYAPGQHVRYKKYTAQIVFCFPAEFNRQCMEDELSEDNQIHLDDIIK